MVGYLPNFHSKAGPEPFTNHCVRSISRLLRTAVLGRFGESAKVCWIENGGYNELETNLPVSSISGEEAGSSIYFPSLSLLVYIDATRSSLVGYDVQQSKEKWTKVFPSFSGGLWTEENNGPLCLGADGKTWKIDPSSARLMDESEGIERNERTVSIRREQGGSYAILDSTTGWGTVFFPDRDGIFTGWPSVACQSSPLTAVRTFHSNGVPKERMRKQRCSTDLQIFDAQGTRVFSFAENNLAESVSDFLFEPDGSALKVIYRALPTLEWSVVVLCTQSWAKLSRISLKETLMINPGFLDSAHIVTDLGLMD